MTKRRSSADRTRSERHWLGKQLVVVDFFCGAGGFTCGALMADAIVVCGIDCDSRARTTYQENNRNGDVPVPFVEARVEDLAPEILARRLRPYRGHPTLFVACPPCQPFTNLRTSKRRSAESKNALRSFIDHVEALKPDSVVVENVPGIQAKKYGTLWEDSKHRLGKAGYEIRNKIVNAASYGVAQKRLRTLLVASRSGEPPWPEPTHHSSEYPTVRQAFQVEGLRCGKRLCRLEAGQACSHDPHHAASVLSELNSQRIRAIRRPGGSRTDWPRDLWLDCYRGHDGHTDVYGRMHWDHTAPTLTTRFVSLSNGRFGHPSENRAITPREGALLQSFPPDYKFLDPSRDQNVIHIGNAVPPLLAYAFVSAVRARCSGYGKLNGHEDQ